MVCGKALLIETDNCRVNFVVEFTQFSTTIFRVCQALRQHIQSFARKQPLNFIFPSSENTRQF